MRAEAKNIRDVKIVEQAGEGAVYHCTLDLEVTDIDQINGVEHPSSDSGTVEYCARPDDPYGLGPTVYAMIQNGEFTGKITDATMEEPDAP